MMLPYSPLCEWPWLQRWSSGVLGFGGKILLRFSPRNLSIVGSFSGRFFWVISCQFFFCHFRRCGSEIPQVVGSWEGRGYTIGPFFGRARKKKTPKISRFHIFFDVKPVSTCCRHIFWVLTIFFHVLISIFMTPF